MREMKDSGISSFGIIPANWEIKKLKTILTLRNEKNSGDRELLSVYLDRGVIAYSDSTGMQVHKPSQDLSNYQNVYIGDFVLNNQQAWRGSVGVSKYDGIISPAYFVYRLADCCYPEYMNYLFRDSSMVQQYETSSRGVGTIQRNIFAPWLLNCWAVLPPLNEQKRIADYLDTKCTEIDALTADIQTQIDTLEQYKRSVITEAVTKGLNPDAEMKDSGIEWVGHIPANWIIHPIYTYFGERKNKNRFGTEDNLLSLSYGRVIRKDINTSDGLLPESFNTYNIVEAGDIIIRPTDLQNDKRSLRTGLVKEHGIITSAYIDLCPIKKVDSRYFHFLLHAYDVMKVFYNMGNGVRQGLNYSEFSRLMVFEPRYEEQVAIADYLDHQCAEIDAIIAQKNEQLSTLEAYKKSLIYEYVTGKKAVSEVGVSIEAIAIDPHVILAGMVIDRLGKNLKGKTEIQKILYLYDAYLGINPGTQYYRYTHGPYDQNLDDYLNTLVANGWFQETSNGAIKYKKGPKHADFCSKYKDAFAKYSREMSKLLSFVKGMKHTSQIERIATAFAVWNDLILEGNSSPTDDEIIREIRMNWTPNKAHSPESTWKGDLTKMKRQGIVPTGQGLHTLPMPKRGVCNE